MADHIVVHHPTVPGGGKTAKTLVATRRLEHGLHAFMMTIVPCPRKTVAAANSAGGNASSGDRMSA
jgi:hypothetical protein